MIRLKSLLLEGIDDSHYLELIKNNELSSAQKMVDNLAKRNRYNYTTYRGDIDADSIFSYTSKERREYGIFTTPEKQVASIYAKNKDPRKFYIKTTKILDLTNDTIENMKWVNKWGESFDDWRDPQSGEELTAWDVLTSSRMFDYEGDWSSERWRDIQAHADNNGFDSIILPDYDSNIGIFPSWVVFDNHNIKLSDVVTHDDNKSIIPLSQRFNSSSDDIRY